MRIHLDTDLGGDTDDLDLLAADVEQGATVVAIGPYTNLALLELDPRCHLHRGDQPAR